MLPVKVDLVFNTLCHSICLQPLFVQAHIENDQDHYFQHIIWFGLHTAQYFKKKLPTSTSVTWQQLKKFLITACRESKHFSCTFRNYNYLQRCEVHFHKGNVYFFSRIGSGWHSCKQTRHFIFMPPYCPNASKPQNVFLLNLGTISRMPRP